MTVDVGPNITYHEERFPEGEAEAMNTLGGYRVHPVADMFPMMDDAELQALADDIQANGLREDIVLMPLDNSGEEFWLVDGRNRYRACQLAGVDPQFGLDNRYFGEPDRIGPWIISHNLHRRHLTASQRAAIAVDYEQHLAADALARKTAGKATEGVTGQASDLAGDMLGVSGRSVRDAKFVANNDRDLFEDVRSGGVSVSAAAKSIRNAASDSASDRGAFACDGDDGWETLYRTVANGLKNLAEDKEPERRAKLKTQLERVVNRIGTESAENKLRHAEVESGQTEWSSAVQNISASIPMDDLTEDQVLTLQGAAEFLRLYCIGELRTRKSRH